MRITIFSCSGEGTDGEDTVIVVVDGGGSLMIRKGCPLKVTYNLSFAAISSRAVISPPCSVKIRSATTLNLSPAFFKKELQSSEGRMINTFPPAPFFPPDGYKFTRSFVPLISETLSASKLGCPSPLHLITGTIQRV